MYLYTCICNCIYVLVCGCVYLRNYTRIYCCLNVFKLVKVSSQVLNDTFFRRLFPVKIESFKTFLIMFSTCFLYCFLSKCIIIKLCLNKLLFSIYRTLLKHLLLVHSLIAYFDKVVKVWKLLVSVIWNYILLNLPSDLAGRSFKTFIWYFYI